MQVYIILSIALLSIVLGFIALLKQKTYIDSKTKQLTKIELPFFGKTSMITNFPALIFVLLGFMAIYIVLLKPPVPTGFQQLEIQGRFVKPPGDTTKMKWDQGSITTIPKLGMRVERNGTFDVILNVEEGTKVGEACERIIYTHEHGSATIIPGKDAIESFYKFFNCL